MGRQTDVPDIMARVAATLDGRDGGVVEPAPEGDREVSVGRLRHLADIEVDFPSGSDRPLVGGAIRLAKRGVRRALRWYLSPIMEQQSRFNHGTLDLIERLRLRLARGAYAPAPEPSDDDVSRSETPLGPGAPQPSRYPDPEIRLKAYVPWFRACGRVVHVECGGGELLRGLAGDGTTAYGVTRDASAAESARLSGLEVLADDAVEHLRGLEPGSTDGLFTSLVAVPRSPRELVALLNVAAAVLPPHGAVVIETATVEDVSGGHGPPPVPARPLHPEAVRAALEATGFSGVRLEVLAPTPGAASANGSESSLAEEVARIDDHLNRRPVTAVIATKQRSTE